MNTVRPNDPMTLDKKMGHRKVYGMLSVTSLVNATASVYTLSGWMETPNSEPLSPMAYHHMGSLENSACLDLSYHSHGAWQPAGCVSASTEPENH